MEWSGILEWLAEYGYIGLFLGAFLGATILPFSSDILFIGLLAAGGDPVLSIISASIGNWLGGITCYILGWLGKWEWIKKFFKVTQEKMEKQKEKISKYGSLLAFFTWLPGIGDPLAVGLGFYRVSFAKTLLFMLLGKTARYIALAAIYF